MAGGRIRRGTLVLPDGLLEGGELWFNRGKIAKICKSPSAGTNGPEPETDGLSRGAAEIRRLEGQEYGENVREKCAGKTGDKRREEYGQTRASWPEWDLQGDYLIPGLVDTHVHGAGGFDVMDGTPEALRAVQAMLLKEGTTAFLPTTMAASEGRLLQVLSCLAQVRREETERMKTDAWVRPANLPAWGAEILGVHMEGPFLAQEYKGAQASAGIWADDRKAAGNFLRRIVEAYPGLVRILTLAPERADAGELIAYCAAQEVIPSAGHSAASYEKMREAVSQGLQRVTHAFNAMPGIHHRRPGLLIVALADDRVALELIADGVHIHPAVLELVLRLKQENRVCLVSDGSRAVGMADGEYELGGQQTFVRQGVARLADGTIAGSAFPLLQGIRTLVRDAHYPLHRAVKAASLIPAGMLGVDGRLGSLELNKEASFVRLTRELNVRQVWLKGVLTVDKLSGNSRR